MYQRGRGGSDGCLADGKGGVVGGVNKNVPAGRGCCLGSENSQAGERLFGKG